MIKKLLLSAITACTCFCLYAQDRTITGTVTSAEDRTTLLSATIQLKGTTIGVHTDKDGKYSINVPKNVPGKKDTLLFSYLGMTTQAIPLTDQKVINIALGSSNKAMKEVVVTALGISREKKALGYTVQTVQGEELQTAKDPSFINEVEGKVAGLSITQTTGGPGSSSRILLRGATSISNDNQALIVIDGVPMENNTNNQTGQWGGRDYGNGISDINPDDIASITVLKGPSAGALYGSLATHGVIVITTKKGTGSKGVNVTFSTSTELEKAYILEKFQNEYGAGSEGQLYSTAGNLWGISSPWTVGSNGEPNYNTQINNWGSWGPKFNGEKVIDWNGAQGTYSAQPNNYANTFQTGYSTNNVLSIDGGADKTSYHISAGNLSDADIIPGTTLERTNISMHLTSAINDKLSMDVSGMYVNQQADNRLQLSDGLSNIARNFILMPRNISSQSLKDSMMYMGGTKAGMERTWFTNWGWMSNPYWDETKELNNDTRDRIVGGATLTYNITKDWNILVRGNTDFNNQAEYNRGAYQGVASPLGSYSVQWLNYKQYSSDAITTYKNKLTHDISFSASLGASVLEKQSESNSVSTSGGLAETQAPIWYNVNNSKNPQTIGYSTSGGRTEGIYAFINLTYKTWLFLDLTGRNDWSSSLPPSNDSYFYPSTSLSYVFTDHWHINNRILSFGKLRASYAYVGDCPTIGSYTNTITYPSAGTFNSSPLYQVNPTVPLLNEQPELTSNFEIGTELMFFKGRIGLDATYYNEDTHNQIVTTSVSATSGYTSAVLNSGEITNKGYELQLKLIPISGKKFKWAMTINAAHNQNEVVSLSNGLSELTMFNQWNISIEAIPGHPFGEIVGYDIERNAQGQKLVDANGYYIRNPIPQIMGNYNPKVLGGITNNFTYKRLGLTFTVDAHIGGQMFSGTNMYGDGYGGNFVQTLPGRQTGIVAQGVTADGKNNTVALTSEDYWNQFANWTLEIQEPFVYNATYIKLREVIFTYSFSKEFAAKLKMKALSASIYGRNLWLIYSAIPNIDPESAYNNGNGQGYEIYSYPDRRSFGFSIKATF